MSSYFHSAPNDFDDEDNELTSIDVQEGDTVKLECRCVLITLDGS